MQILCIEIIICFIKVLLNKSKYKILIFEEQATLNTLKAIIWGSNHLKREGGQNKPFQQL